MTTPTPYPETRRVRQLDEYFGVAVADPYRWLEELDSSEVAAWVEAQNAVSQPFLDGLPGRDAVEARLRELWSCERFGVPFKEGGSYFFTRNDGLQDQDVLYRAATLDGEPEVVVDPNALSDDATISLASFAVAPDGRHVAYALSDGGSDWKTWRVREVASGRDLEDELAFTKFTVASWARDGESFYYSRYPAGPDGRGDDTATVAVYRHRLGTPQRQDEPVYALLDRPRQNPYAYVTEDGRFLVVTVQEGYEANAVHLLRLDRPDAPPQLLLDDWDALYAFIGNRGGELFFHTTREALRYRVVAIDVEASGAPRWREVVPESGDTLEGAHLVGGRIVARYMRNARSHVEVHDVLGGRLAELELPGLGSAGGFSGKPGDPETFFGYTSFTRPPAIYRYDVVSGELRPVREPELSFDPNAYETRQVLCESRDGTRVPMFITHRKGLERDGRQPTLLYGYGGFNVALKPAYETAWAAWLEMGGVLAVPNLRGGGEFGEEWHRSGTRTRKQNVFDDFIAAAEWLVAERYTSAKRLAIQGGSNGGLLVGAAMVQRPELFAAALPAVGVLDMLRYHLSSANARSWSSDYGLSEDEQEFHALLAYSPYHSVEPGCYPATLITTGDHDDRVVPWHSYKFGAALQRAQSCGAPILLRVETRAGHGAGTPTWMRIQAVTDRLVFLAAALGMDGAAGPLGEVDGWRDRVPSATLARLRSGPAGTQESSD